MKAPKTIKPKKLYGWLVWHRDLEKAVESMTTPQLRVLNGYLAREGAQSGIPSLIHGLVLYVMAGRLMIQKDAKE